jgi:broad specificity phosphatase PhoE
LQAERLGKYFANKGLKIDQVFSSDLQRAFKTANAICSWSKASQGGKLEVTPLMVLREQDFGFYEGKPFYARSKDSNKSGKDKHCCEHRDDPDFVDVESKESMALRMNQFLQDHLIPLLHAERKEKEQVVAIVSHGIILSHLWRCFLKLLPNNSVTLSPGLSVGTGGVTPLEYLGGWSNTGYLELDVQKTTSRITGTTSDQGISASSKTGDKTASLHNHKVVIKTVNGKEHLQGLKRTKGVGSSKYDEGQKSIDSFFKKQKVG